MNVYLSFSSINNSALSRTVAKIIDLIPGYLVLQAITLLCDKQPKPMVLQGMFEI